MRNASTVNSFTTLLNENRQIPPTYFKVDTRTGQILQARLRMECSSLNAHLYSKNVVPTPSCECGAFESPNHYLLHCPRYKAIRERYLHSYLDSHNTHDLLYGKESSSDSENKVLFQNVQEFIIQSKRFA